MARYIPDAKTRRWVIIAPRRSTRPDEHEKTSGETGPKKKFEKRNGFAYLASCPFCFGNEDQTPPEVYRWGRSYPTDSDWILRVVPNKYPITDIHEVIIHSPDHQNDVVNFSLDHLEILLKVYRERYNTLSAYGHVLIFNNKGEGSGESLSHPHSQVVVIPQQIRLDALSIEPVNNIIEENGYFIVYCPDFSQWPYEVWVAPKACVSGGHQTNHHFGRTSDNEISSLAEIMQRTLKKLYSLLSGYDHNRIIAYNYYIYPYECWYLRIIPRNILIRAGFEQGTGIHVNTVDPAEAALELRDVPSTPFPNSPQR